MKKFRFRLERVLNYRESVKAEKRRELMKRNLVLREESARLEMIEEAFRNNQLTGDGILSPGEIELRGLFAEKLQNDMINQRLVILQAEKAVEVAFEEYVVAVKEAESLSTLKRRRLAEYLEEISKEEEKFLDELAVQKGNRISGEN